MTVYTPGYTAAYTAGMPVGTPGGNVELFFNFYNEQTGVLTDPATVQLDITFGSEVGFVPDVAGPFAYSGASSPAPNTVFRIGVGQYGFVWQIPAAVPTGIYTANWTVLFGTDLLLGVENFAVTGGFSPPVPAGDIGYWTGSIDYEPPAGSFANLSGVSIPLGAVDDNGIAWLLQKVTGWDGPDVQGGGVIAKAGDHGAWAAPQYYAARAISLSITASAPTQALRDLARALLQQAVPISDLATFTYNEPMPKQAAVRRSGKITETYPTLTDVTFSIALIAPDPRKYSTQVNSVTVNAFPTSIFGVTVPLILPFTLPAQSPAGIVAVTNAGNFETRPVITINGPVTSPQLINVTTGQTVSWTGLALGAGQSLVVDFNVAQAFLNGVYHAADLFSSWWTLPPGTSTIQLAGNTAGGGSMTVQWQSAWI